jgi:hypothetical protein
MPHLRLILCRIDDPAADTLTELASFDLPTPDVATLQPATALDDLETTLQTTGNVVLRCLLQAAWDAIDAELAAAYRRQVPPGSVRADGYEPLTVISRFGTLQLRRRLLYHPATKRHVVPGNAMLPAHDGVITTRGLQEWACLLPQELPFASVARLLGWQTQEASVLSAGTVRTLVRHHGQLIRQAEQAMSVPPSALTAPAGSTPVLVPHARPRRRAGWPADLNVAVEAALAAEQVRPPQGVSWADWERVLEARRAEASWPVEELRTLGPTLAEDEVLLTIDEVLTRRASGQGFWELRTAKLVTPAGYRYLSGTGDAFVQVLLRPVLAAVGSHRALLLISDGARWIRTVFRERLAPLPRSTHLLDWHHLAAKCRDLSSRICRDKEAKGAFLRRLCRRLWAGKVAEAVIWLERYRRRAKHVAVLDELIVYLQARSEWVPNYRQRRRARQYIGSGHGEKANDLIVARRQKRRGMQWSLETSETLAALRTLLLNGGWERYWAAGEVLPLVEAKAA